MKGDHRSHTSSILSEDTQNIQFVYMTDASWQEEVCLKWISTTSLQAEEQVFMSSIGMLFKRSPPISAFAACITLFFFSLQQVLA